MAGLASRYIDRHPGYSCRCYCYRHNAVVSIVAVLTQTPGRLLTNRRANRERRGYRELADGMLALASGDAARAMKHARKANTFLGRSAAGQLIVAEAAVLQGKFDLAKERFKSLLEDQHTVVAGARGLLTHAVGTENDTEALMLAEKVRSVDLKCGVGIAEIVRLTGTGEKLVSC